VFCGLNPLCTSRYSEGLHNAKDKLLRIGFCHAYILDLLHFQFRSVNLSGNQFPLVAVSGVFFSRGPNTVHLK
jgi:hypothetical protein